MVEPQRVGPGFAPVAGPRSHVLILGSFPSAKSREVGFYYGHPQNRFWPLMAHLLGQPIPETIEQKKALILQNGLALWDTVCCCTITGASDASIRNVQPNDIAMLCRTYPIEKIYCNGAASFRVYQKYAQEQTGITAEKLPSTSPANAAWRMEHLQTAWAQVIRGQK